MRQMQYAVEYYWHKRWFPERSTMSLEDAIQCARWCSSKQGTGDRHRVVRLKTGKVVKQFEGIHHG